MIHAQGNHSITYDFDKDIPWNQGLTLSQTLLPIPANCSFINELTKNEKHAASWVLGLLAASAIKEHEKVLNQMRTICFEREPKAKNNHAFAMEGKQFFLEEAVHSAAFSRFLDMTAKELNLSREELSSFLPSFDKKSLVARLYAFEGLLGGKAIWWTVAATEEESIRLFQQMAPHKNHTDSVFFSLNRLHFLEESRHSSFSYEMLSMPEQSWRRPITRLSFAVSRILQTIWLIGELKRFRKVSQFQDRHPILKSMNQVVEKIDVLPFKSKLKLIFNEISYIKMMTQPEKHPRLKKTLAKIGAFVLKTPGIKS
ncbi:hypothetical protein [Peredibacter starrii]|uniref:p-aminobenzoate N-oxygenase AurF n=1 Tax=Peredibacter starrii TaxID=28202 RepID=A0AAX4HMU9_9BACT|nr:hypothetical protein [Peredibacter starrii]WPU64209.1 hypothetical protein SOO65_16055 [Peredibacter starrii]